MAPFSGDTWVLIGAVAAACLLAFLHALAALYRDQTMLHDVKCRVLDLRREYAERLARERAEEIIEVDSEPSPRAEHAPAAAQTPSERTRAAA